ncbi:MAG: hypothetical protein KF784_04995 [Fimbriimonadaceae bacterium]|nr:hypothetical protein [Fimbriimonadaceae bacterium]
MKVNKKLSLIVAGSVLMSTFAFSQLDKILKIGGVIAVVNTFGKDIDKGINKLWGREQTKKVKTKVVPIYSVGLNSDQAIGAAQVMGPPDKVDSVVAVAQPEAKILGNQLRLKALIPVASKNWSNIKGVEEVGVSGIVDIKL